MRPGGLIQRPKFSPLSIANCVCWLRSDLGLDPGQADNTAAPNWRSQVPGGGDCSQATAAKQPIWHASWGLNNRPYLAFNGSKGYVWASDLGGAETIFMVLRVTTSPGAGAFYTIYSAKRSSDSTFCEWCYVNSAGYKTNSFRFDYQGAGVAIGYDSTLGTTNGHCVITTYNGGGNSLAGSYTEMLDGTSQALTASSVFARTPTDLGSIGSRLNSAQAISFGAIIEKYELARYSRVLNAEEKAQLKNYATGLYGTP